MIGLLHLAIGSLLLLVVRPAGAQEADASLRVLIDGNADFAARLYRAVASRTDDNVLLAPLALSTALAALMSGASGSTRQQILQGLGLTSLDPQTIPDLYQNLRSSVTPGLRQGVGVLPSKSFTVSPAYQDLVQTRYGGSVQSLQDLESINRWAQDQTGDQVRDLLDSLDSQTTLLLATACFYQSQFTLAFNATVTQEERFYVDKYHIVQAPMMFRADKYFLAYDRSLKLGVLKLPMTDGAAMLVLLPDEGVDITAIEEELTGERIRAWIRQLKKTKLEVQLPRLLLERSYSLQDVLQTLELSEAFTDQADLSNISEDKSLKLTQVVQKVVVSLDESGSGAEGGGVDTFNSLPPRLTINRPFLFVIYQESSGSLLLMSRVQDPSRK